MTELSPTPFGPVLIVGTGMMGCTIGRLIRQSYPTATVWGIDRDPRVARLAEDEGHVSRGFSSERLPRLLAEVGLVIVATPIDAILALLPELAAGCRPGALVLDLGSSKEQICSAAAGQERMRCGEVAFVGGHPMASSVRAGPSGADPGRLRGVPFVLCPLGSVPAALIARLERFLVELSFRPTQMMALEHDQLVCAVSHVPHLLSVALASWVGRRAKLEGARHPRHYRIAGRSLGAMTASAAGSPELWLGILRSNADASAQGLRELARMLDRLADAVVDPSAVPLQMMLREAAATRVELEQLGFDVAGELPERAP